MKRKPKSTPKGRVTGIGGVFLKARDPKRMAAWYRKHLGIQSQEGHADFLWREKDRPGKVSRTVWALFPADTDYFKPSRSPFMLNYRVTNLGHLVEELRRKGVKIEKVAQDDYGRFAWLSDPEGNRVELWEPKDKPNPVVRTAKKG
ncbi:MAG TPA: VOC family protein [Candidatus Binatia bacterium]|jgi:predicted enzyme related to lactoylglutathione lyase|nr:VOC family protein [Candidatus Binatia bacterium]